MCIRDSPHSMTPTMLCGATSPIFATNNECDPPITVKNVCSALSLLPGHHRHSADKVLPILWRQDRNYPCQVSINAVSYTHLDVYKRQLYKLGLYTKYYLILFEFAAVIVCHRKYPC